MDDEGIEYAGQTIDGKLKWLKSWSVSNNPNEKVIEVLEDDETRHQYKNGSVVACKKPAEKWLLFAKSGTKN